MEQFLGPETDVKHQFLDPETDIKRQFLVDHPETDIMDQFLDSETDIMGKRTYIVTRVLQVCFKHITSLTRVLQLNIVMPPWLISAMC